MLKISRLPYTWGKSFIDVFCKYNMMTIQPEPTSIDTEQGIGKLAIRRYPILRVLYPDIELSLGELVAKTRVDDGNLSRYVTELSENGLVNTHDEKREGGKPRKLIRLTEAARSIIDSLITLTGAVPKPIKPADEADIEFYMKIMDEFNNPEAQDMASEEFMILCGKQFVMHDDNVLPFLKSRILDPRYTPIRETLLRALLNIVRNANSEEKRDKIRPIFDDLLTSLVSEPLEERDLRDMALQILGAITHGDKGYGSMIGMLESFIKRDDPLATRTREITFTRYPEKKDEVRRSLFTMLLDPDVDVVQRVKNHIRELRVDTPASIYDARVRTRRQHAPPRKGTRTSTGPK